MKNSNSLILAFIAVLAGGCSDLDEKPYSIVVKGNYFQTKDDVIRATLRTYDQAYSSLSVSFEFQENSSDEMMTPNRQGHWLDGQYYYRQHYHTWTPQDRFASDTWNSLYQGIAQANNSIEDLQTIDVAKFGFTEAEVKRFIADLRVFRAWYHLRLLDYYRNIVISTTYKDADPKTPQSTPEETVSFLEKELQEVMADLPAKAAGTNGRWTKAGAMSLLARLYLNAAIYTGTDRFADCARICQDLIDGVYGNYGLATEWDGAFDFDNHESPETIFAFPSRAGFSSYHYTGGIYNLCIPYLAAPYFQAQTTISPNFKYALQPGRDVDSVEYSFSLGKPLVKFQKYPDDIRLKKYVNLGGSKREGMFLWGYLVNPETGARIQGTKGYDYYIRDQVGIFNRLVGTTQVSYGPGEGHLNPDKQSDMTHADENSGVFVIKYPVYPSSDPNSLESDYVEIRMAEIYYSLAECKFRAGDKAGASELLNTVRRRYYPSGSPSLYNQDGSELTEQELLDEWGREFLAEGRRRTDLIRFDKFTKGTWWDKSPDPDDHTNIMPIGQAVLLISPQLRQNPGY